MAYFPFYVELKDVSVLIVGGGKVALHKVKRILDYGPKIKVVAKKVDERIKNIKGVLLSPKALSILDTPLYKPVQQIPMDVTFK